MTDRTGVRVLAAVIVALSGAGASAQVVNFDISIDGEINGQTIEGTGSGSMDRQGFGDNNAIVAFDQMPLDFNPIAFDTMLTNICPNGFRADGQSDNLWDLGGGNYSIERTFQWIGVPGSLVTQTAEVFFDSQKDLMFSSMTFEGEYRGPSDLVGIDSYNVLWLPGSTDGEVFEAGTAVLNRANGEQLIVQFATRYFGLRDNLSEPQIGIGGFDTTYDGQTLTMGWSGYFEVPAPGGLGALALAGVVAGRRRR